MTKSKKQSFDTVYSEQSRTAQDKNAKSQKPKGFTLIELIISVSIVIILSSIGIASYNNFNNTQILRQAAANFKNNLRSAQNKAINGEKLCGPGANECGGLNSTCGDEDAELSFSGWEVKLNTFDYDIRGVCGGNVYFSSKNYLLAENSLVKFTSQKTITFSASPMTIINAGDICLKDVNSTKTYKLTLTASGEIKDYGIILCN